MNWPVSSREDQGSGSRDDTLSFQPVIPQRNKTVWPLRLAPVRPALLKKMSQPSPLEIIKWNVNPKIQV